MRPPAIRQTTSRVWCQYLGVAADLWTYLDLHKDFKDGTPRCNAYAASACVLGLLTLESYALSWMDFHLSEDDPKRKLQFKLEGAFDIPGWPLKREEQNDLVLLRDALIHAHLVQSEIDPRDFRKVQSQQLKSLSGNKQAKKIVDGQERRSPHLKLHLDPSMVDRSDCQVVFWAFNQVVQGNLASKNPRGLESLYICPSRKNEPISAMEWLQKFRSPAGG